MKQFPFTPMEEVKKTGRKKSTRPLKKAYGISLTPDEIECLEAKASTDGVNTSQYIIKKLKLS